MLPDVHDLLRMPVDSVPRTNEIKEKMWVPGPDGDMYVISLLCSKSNFSIPLQTDRFDNMRYFWGFVQLQDILDNAIIEMKTDTVRLGSWWVVLYTCMIVKWIIVLSKPIRERISGPNLNWLRLFKTGFFSSSSPTHASRGTTSYLVSTQFN